VSGFLQKVERAAAKAAVSREALEAAMRDAHAEGASLRAIATAASVSYETVRRVVA
jgi:transposase